MTNNVNAIPTAMTPVELEYVTCPNCKSEIMKVYYLNVPVTTQPALCPVCDYPIGAFCHETQVIKRVDPVSVIPVEIIEPEPPAEVEPIEMPTIEVEPIVEEMPIKEVKLPVEPSPPVPIEEKPIPWLWIAIGVVALLILVRR